MDQKTRVLVIDDEPGVLRFIKISLSSVNFDVITSTNGEEGLKLARSQTPDIILLDLVMDPLDGFEVLSKLREFSTTPVIIFTARNDLGTVAVENGANSYISKPFRPDQLIKLIKEVLDSKTPDSLHA